MKRRFAVLAAALAALAGPLPAAGTDGDEPVELGFREAVILGLVEGITEFLPISSTGHLLLANELLGLNSDAPAPGPDGDPVVHSDGRPYTARDAANAYAIVIQGGAILAVVVLYRRRVLAIVTGLFGRDPRGLRLGINLLIAFLPAAVFGLLFNEWIERKLFHPGPIAAALLGGAVLMWFAEGHRRRRHAAGHEGPDLPDLDPLQCLIIGLLQCVAMWPGTSRSMMTIVGGYLVGLSPVRAAEFSFLLGLVTLSAASGYTLVSDGSNMFEALRPGPVIAGLLVSFVAAALAVKWLVAYLARHGLGLFAWYRIVLAVLVYAFMA